MYIIIVKEVECIKYIMHGRKISKCLGFGIEQVMSEKQVQKSHTISTLSPVAMEIE